VTTATVHHFKIELEGYALVFYKINKNQSYIIFSRLRTYKLQMGYGSTINRPSIGSFELIFAREDKDHNTKYVQYLAAISLLAVPEEI